MRATQERSHASNRARRLEPGEVYRFRLDLEATSNFFGPGHRVPLEVSSSKVPRRARNTNTVHSGGRYASYRQLSIRDE